jgi:predicted alpha/beta-hydrolase family hydrolase
MVKVYLGHGASGTAASMQPYVEGLRKRGIEAFAPDLPKGSAERAMPVYRAAVEDPAASVIGGHSFGGRVASMLAAEETFKGLVLLSYPLHRPGHADDLRTEHWPRISCPVLLLSGESDPFAKIELLRREVKKFKHHELYTYPAERHGLLAIADAVAERIAGFARVL